MIAAVFPKWLPADVCLIPETEGLTNKRKSFTSSLFYCYHQLYHVNPFVTVVKCVHAPSSTTILIRTYGRGSEVLIDRNQEYTNMTVLSKLRLGPRVFARFRNGLVYGYTGKSC